jgi:hypothetical protein
MSYRGTKKPVVVGTRTGRGEGVTADGDRVFGEEHVLKTTPQTSCTFPAGGFISSLLSLSMFEAHLC